VLAQARAGPPAALVSTRDSIPGSHDTHQCSRNVRNVGEHPARASRALVERLMAVVVLGKVLGLGLLLAALVTALLIAHTHMGLARTFLLEAGAAAFFSRSSLRRSFLLSGLPSGLGVGA
jgi:hypothetical protein